MANIFLTDIPLFLYDLYVYPQETRGVRGAANSLLLPPNTASNNVAISNANINQIHPNNTTVLTQNSALTVINPITQDRIEVYAQLDPGSEVTLSLLLWLKSLVYMAQPALELSCVQYPEARHQTYNKYHLRLKLCIQDERLRSRTPWCWMHGLMKTLPCHTTMILQPTHSLMRWTFKSYQKGRKVDILIGLDNSHLMTALEERTGDEGEPHAIHTPLGWIASGGKVLSKSPTIPCDFLYIPMLMILIKRSWNFSKQFEISLFKMKQYSYLFATAMLNK